MTLVCRYMSFFNKQYRSPTVNYVTFNLGLNYRVSYFVIYWVPFWPILYLNAAVESLCSASECQLISKDHIIEPDAAIKVKVEDNI